MKYLDEYRDPLKVKTLLTEIESVVTRNWVIMEICGGQTHAFLHNGLDAMLPSQIELVHGLGCPVCVTPLEQIDRALTIASRPDVIFTSYGDMLREEFQDFDAEIRFDVDNIFTQESSLCIAGEILQGLKKPLQCSAFGKQCTQQTPLGAPMVSAEGACAAYYRYHREAIHR